MKHIILSPKKLEAQKSGLKVKAINVPLTSYCKKLVCFQYYSFKKMVVFKLINSVLSLAL